VTVFILGYISYISILSFLEKDALVDHAFSVIEKLEHVLSTVIDAETGQRGFIITGEQRYLQPYDLTLQNIDNQLHELNIMTTANTDSPKVKNMINSSLIPLIQNKLVDLNETINLREHQGFNAALQVVLSDKGKRITDDIRTDITNMENEENNLLANRAKQLEAVGNNTIYTITIGILIASLVTALSIIVINNRTNRKHLEEKKLLENEVQVRTKQLHESNEQLKVHDKMQKEFINVAAHELRTPVQPILGLSDVLLSKKGNIEQYKDLLDAIKRNAKRLHHLTEDILDITKIESQSLQLRKQRINLNEVILGVIAEYASQIKKAKNVNLSFISKDDDIFVEAERIRLSQVFDNILSNAIKFTQEGNITIAIQRNGEEYGGGLGGDHNNNNNYDQIIVSIKDTGTGIDPEIVPRLFTKFATKSITGTGLGLFISKSIVEAHGGKMWGENNTDGKGATFYISLPLSK
jgi:signal transduction histidine kinase